MLEGTDLSLCFGENLFYKWSKCKVLIDGHAKALGLFAARDGDTSTRQSAVFWKLMAGFAQYHKSGFTGV